MKLLTQNEVLIKYAPLVNYLARTMSVIDSEIDDLMQLGFLGVLKAYKVYDDDRETKFSTFATLHIMGAIKHYHRDKSQLIKIPRTIDPKIDLIPTFISLCGARDPEDDKRGVVAQLEGDEAIPLDDSILLRESIAQIIYKLPKVQQRLIRYRYYEDMTQQKIAEKMGISQMHVSRLLSSALRQLRREYV